VKSKSKGKGQKAKGKKRKAESEKRKAIERNPEDSSGKHV
jgi:hypothetical protein